jgi:hypothetical protein
MRCFTPQRSPEKMSWGLKILTQLRKSIEAASNRDRPGFTSGNQSYSQFQFPRIDVTFDDQGTNLDYSFFITGQEMVSPNFSYTTVSLNTATYRVQ